MLEFYKFAYCGALVLSFAASLACFLSNRKYRGSVDAALAAAGHRPPLEVPERMKSYDLAYLNVFKAAAARQPTRLGKTVLQLYIRPTLLWIDVGFAISFSCFIALLWAGVPMLLPTLPYVAPVSQFCIAMALAYGVADVAEDLWLSKLLSQTSTLTNTEAEVACRLTQLKLLTISLSLAGGLIFMLLSSVFPTRDRAP